MALSGTILSYDSKRRSGLIRDTNTKQLYYFAKISVVDHTLPLLAKTHVRFDLHELKDRDPVAVRVRADVKVENPSPVETKDHKLVTVLWFNMEKKYGFVREVDNPTFDAFLHLNSLHESGIREVHRGQHLRVRFEATKQKSFAAVDVKLVKDPAFKKEFVHSDKHLHENLSHLQASGSHLQAPQRLKGHVSSQVKTEPGSKQLYNITNKPTGKVNVTNNDLSTIPTISPTPKKLLQPSIKHHFSPMKGAVPQLTKEQQEIQKSIQQKQSLLRTLDLAKLPDGGQRIKDQITALQLKLKSLPKQEPVKTENTFRPLNIQNPSRYRSANAGGVIDLTDDDHYGISGYGRPAEDQFPNTGEFYGGRMTTNRLNLVTKVTVNAIETLHASLDTCPPPETELTDPMGLQVKLMTHQRQALAWLVWREKQSVSGGILADDMGLGKTLTMISLILKQNEKKMTADVKEEKKVEDLSDKLDSCQISDDKSSHVKIKTETPEVKQETHFDDTEDKKPTLPECNTTLIVAPASLIYHWEAEIKNRCRKGLLSVHLYHGNGREKDPSKLAKFDVVLTTYDLVRRCYSKSKNSENKGSKLVKGNVEDVLFHLKFRRIILDESHQIRNYKSQTSESACALSATSRWAMSGTPVQNQLADMFAMIKFLHCQPFDEYKLWKNQVDIKTHRGQQRMKTLVSCFVLRREKSQKGLDGKPLVPLPPRNFTTHKLQLNNIEREVYKKLESDSQAAFSKYERWKRNKERGDSLEPGDSSQKKMTATFFIVMLLRLRQCCGHLHLLQKSFDPEILEKEKQEVAVEDLFQSLTIGDGGKPSSLDLKGLVETDKAKYFEISAQSSKITFVLDRLKELQSERPNDKFVVISQWTSMLHILTYHLNEANFSYAIIEGSVTAQKRMELVETFNRCPTKIKVMLISLQAGGVGLNLIGGNHLFLLDMHWNPALEKQAFDRIYRVGQRKEVFVHKFMMENTVEEKILQLQEQKLSIAKAVMEGAVTDNKIKLTLADMRMLFGINN